MNRETRRGQISLTLLRPLFQVLPGANTVSGASAFSSLLKLVRHGLSEFLNKNSPE